MSDSANRHRIVIVGGGFGGVYTAIHLGRIWRKRRGTDAGADIVLVSRENYFLMTPFLFEAGSGVLDPRPAVAPRRRLPRDTAPPLAEAGGGRGGLPPPRRPPPPTAGGAAK